MTDSDFTPQMRFNWGFWDGFNARQQGRWDMQSFWFNGSRQSAQRHPTDSMFGQGFWAGFNWWSTHTDGDSPTSSTDSWTQRQSPAQWRRSRG